MVQAPVLSAEAVRAAARGARFSLVGLARAEPLDPRPLESWLAAGYAADMTWMARRLPERLDPTAVLAGAQTVIALAIAYHRPAGETGADRALRPRPRLPLRPPRPDEGPAQAPARARSDAGDVRVRRHGRRDGEAMGRAGRAGLDRQERLPHQPAARVVADPVGDVRRPRRRRATTRPPSSAAATAPSASAPVRRAPSRRPAWSTRAAASPTTASRTRTWCRRSAAGGLRRPDLRLRRLPGGLPLESPAAARGRPPVRAAPAVGAGARRGRGAGARRVRAAGGRAWRWRAPATTACAGTRFTRSAPPATAPPAAWSNVWSTTATRACATRPPGPCNGSVKTAREPL